MLQRADGHHFIGGNFVRILILCFLLLISTHCRGELQSPPNQVESILNAQFPHWQFVTVKQDARDFLARHGNNAGQPSQVRGDFNSDQATDHALQIVYTKGDQRTYALVALLSSTSGFDPHILDEWKISSSEELGIYLEPLKKGAPVYDYDAGKTFVLERDAFVVNLFEKSASVYLYENETFRKVLISD